MANGIGAESFSWPLINAESLFSHLKYSFLYDTYYRYKNPIVVSLKEFLEPFMILKGVKKPSQCIFQSFSSSSCQIFFVYCQAASWVQYENHLIFLVFALLQQQQQFSSCTKGNFSSTTWEMHLHLLLFSAAVATASAEVQSSLWVFCTLFQWLQISR